jgi:hypothetical protein
LGQLLGITRLCIGLPGLAKTAIFEAVGTISRNISISLLVNCPGTKVARPVMLPPGRQALHEADPDEQLPDDRSGHVVERFLSLFREPRIAVPSTQCLFAP